MYLQSEELTRGINNMKEVIIEKNWENKYSVSVIHWQGKEGIKFNHNNDLNKAKAKKEASRISKIYNCLIREISNGI